MWLSLTSQRSRFQQYTNPKVQPSSPGEEKNIFCSRWFIKVHHEILSSENPIQFFEQELTKELGEIPEKNWHCIPSVIKVVFLTLNVYFEKQNNTEYTNKLQHLLDNITRSCNNKLHES